MNQMQWTPLGPPLPPPVPPPMPVAFTGKRRDFFELVRRGAGLELVTLGFYRFWLLTDIRRHLWANTLVDGDAAENATKVALDAIQCLGGNGYINDYPTGRLLRDAKLYEIGAGTSEIRRMLIGRELFEKTA